MTAENLLISPCTCTNINTAGIYMYMCFVHFVNNISIDYKCISWEADILVWMKNFGMWSEIVLLAFNFVI